MKILLPALVFVLSVLFTEKAEAQAFPNPASLSTGQGAQGSLDPIWQVTGWYNTPPNPSGLTFTPALISNNCAPGSWVDPTTLTPPENNGNWITNPSYPCATNTNSGYMDFRLTVVLPPACNGQSISAPGAYTLYLSGYVDNTITDVFVNTTSTGFSGGAFSAGSQLNMTLTGPWVAGANYIDVVVDNFGNGGGANPYGLLLVANSNTTYANGCPPAINGDTVICAGVSTKIWVNETGYSYLWSNGATTDTITVSPGSTTNYSVIVYNSYGFRDTTAVNVTVHPTPVIPVNPAAPSICIGGQANLTAGGAVSYVWSDAETTASITVTPGSTITYTVTGTDANSCTAAGTATVTVNPLPVAAINPPQTEICYGTNATLTGSGGVAYVWSNAATTTAVTVSPSTTSPYLVTATDIHGCSATAISTVTVNPLPVAVITPPAVQICLGFSTTLTASGGLTYAWSDAETTAAITVAPVATTTYAVTTTDANLCTASASAVVTVNNPPVVAINPATVQICLNGSTTLTASGGVGYLWSNTSTTNTITVSPTVTTTYSVTATDINTCIDSANSTVTVNLLPVAVINPATAQICEGDSTALTASGGTIYLWSNAATAAAITIAPMVATTYSVTVTDANSCSASAAAPVTVDPYITVSISPTNIDCNGAADGKIDLTAAGGQTPFGYMWSTSATTQNVSGLSPGRYSAIVTDALGCSASAGASISEPTALQLASAVTNPTCPSLGNDGNISISDTGGVLPYRYFWSDSSVSENLNSVGPGNYSLTVTDANGCTAGANFVLAYIYDFSVQASRAATIKLGESTTLGYSITGNAGNYVNFWSPSFGLNCIDCVAPVAQPNATTLYHIEVKNDSGCVATDTVTVTVIPDYGLFVPNVFTPNGDGKNDEFKIFGNLGALEYFNVRIFNRMGEIVFESNDANFGWDGTFKGVIQLPGVFVYEMKLVFTDGHSDGIRTGTITLMR